ncbi:hypothetical protein [Burkholderia ubonensis]|uniref:hypothetical protein n=1 Tax=Burkholderia ubonensis TaxID=101571 RepID=UPI0012F9CDFB|nr:hypothetical protein [Burkholderia ubonensis]
MSGRNSRQTTNCSNWSSMSSGWNLTQTMNGWNLTQTMNGWNSSWMTRSGSS